MAIIPFPAALSLGMNKPVSGAVPHGIPGRDERGASGGAEVAPKTAAAHGMYGSIGECVYWTGGCGTGAGMYGWVFSIQYVYGWVCVGVGSLYETLMGRHKWHVL